jgi:hypothetical protein
MLRFLNIQFQTIERWVHAQLYSGGTGFETMPEPQQSLPIFLRGFIKPQYSTAHVSFLAHDTGLL